MVPRRGQTPRQSLAEASVNVGLGIAINLLVVWAIFRSPLWVNVGTTGLMTAISFVRQYGVRRFFNLFT